MAPLTTPPAATSAPTNGSPPSRSTCVEQVESIVTSVVGAGHSRVQVNADFDFNRITQTSDKFDPDGRVLRSSQTREETSASNEGGSNQVTVGNELPGAAQRQAAAADNTPRDESRKSEEIVNYEISKTTKTEVIEGGRVNRISVAVLVDGTYSKDDKGDVSYQPRSKEDLDQIGTLVRSAIGFDQKRGDQVEVVNLRFAETPAISIGEPTGWLSAFRFTKDDIMRVIEIGGDGSAWTHRAAAGGAAAGAPHHYAENSTRSPALPPGLPLGSGSGHGNAHRRRTRGSRPGQRKPRPPR